MFLHAGMKILVTAFFPEFSQTFVFRKGTTRLAVERAKNFHLPTFEKKKVQLKNFPNVMKHD